MLSTAEMWTTRRPRVTDWCERIKERPTDTPALRDWRPPDLTNDLGDVRRAEPAGGQASAGRLESVWEIRDERFCGRVGCP